MHMKRKLDMGKKFLLLLLETTVHNGCQTLMRAFHFPFVANALSVIPTGLLQLRKLSYLDLSNNRITEVQRGAGLFLSNQLS